MWSIKVAREDSVLEEKELRYFAVNTQYGWLAVVKSRYGIIAAEFLNYHGEDLCKGDKLAEKWVMENFPDRLLEREDPRLWMFGGRYSWPDESEIALHLIGSEFSREVWRKLLEISPGETVTYGELAEMIGRPRAARGVGRAVGSNSIALFVPCHRVVPKNARRGFGEFGNYKWGADLKSRILSMEMNLMPPIR